MGIAMAAFRAPQSGITISDPPYRPPLSRLHDAVKTSCRSLPFANPTATPPSPPRTAVCSSLAPTPILPFRLLISPSPCLLCELTLRLNGSV